MAEPLHRQIARGDYESTAFPIAMTATVLEDVTHINEGAFVSIYIFDGGEIPHGPCPWMPRMMNDGTYMMPSAGDSALVVMDENDDAWIVCWWPYANETFDGDSEIDPAADGTPDDSTPPPDEGDTGS